MKNIKPILVMLFISAIFVSCDKDALEKNDELSTTFSADAVFSDDMLSDVWVQEDQVARPAINTVFTPSGKKDLFNVTIPFDQQGLFASDFLETLKALNPTYTANILKQNAETFTSFLATDVLNISLVDPTTFFDGTNVLTGRALADDVIDVELILIFGGPDLDDLQNPGLISDNVDSNDVAFLSSFPYLAEPHQ